jgi:multiple sugar transport system permease protein
VATTQLPAVLAEKKIKSRPHPSRRLSSKLTPWAFLVAPLVLLLTFTYIPLGNMVYYSTTIWDGLAPVKKFVGLDNYVTFFNRPELLAVFTVSLYYFVASIFQIGFALYFATILSFNVRFKSLFKGIIFFPYLVNGVAVGFIFLYFFQPGGTLDTVLGLFGYSGHQQWLGDRTTINMSLAATSMWRFLGLNFVIFLGALQSISAELYESAELDGASRWQQFAYIILPSIRPLVGLSFILAISGCLSVFEIPFIMTGGANGSKTFVIQTIDTAFKFNKFGLASAMAVILTIIVLAVTYVQRRLVPDEKAAPR